MRQSQPLKRFPFCSHPRQPCHLHPPAVPPAPQHRPGPPQRLQATPVCRPAGSPGCSDLPRARRPSAHPYCSKRTIDCQRLQSCVREDVCAEILEVSRAALWHSVCSFAGSQRVPQEPGSAVKTRHRRPWLFSQAPTRAFRRSLEQSGV